MKSTDLVNGFKLLDYDFPKMKAWLKMLNYTGWQESKDSTLTVIYFYPDLTVVMTECHYNIIEAC